MERNALQQLLKNEADQLAQRIEQQTGVLYGLADVHSAINRKQYELAAEMIQNRQPWAEAA